jgi:hypothetical protein
MQLTIFGADFLQHFRLVVDLVAGQLLDTTTTVQFRPAMTVTGTPLLANIKALPPEFRDLFSEFQDVANLGGSVTAFKHGVQYVLDTFGGQ